LFQSTAISTEEYDTRRQARDQNVAAVKSAQAALETAQLNLDYSKVIAPISGKLGRRMITEGNLVTADVTNLTTLVSLDPIYSYVNVDEPTILKYQELIRQGKRKNIAGGGIPCALGIGNGDVFTKLGHLDFVDNQFDSATGTLVCRGVFENHDRYLIPGQFVRVRVDGSEPYPAMLVPEQSVQKDQDKRSVLVVGPDNTLQPRVVSVGSTIGNLCVITSGLTESDWVVMDSGILHAGMPIKPDEQSVIPDDATLSAAAPIPDSATGVIR
jgi:multidrug efflux system membrane fusion protein